jgi:hypothetical protein
MLVLCLVACVCGCVYVFVGLCYDWLLVFVDVLMCLLCVLCGVALLVVLFVFCFFALCVERYARL